jgi:hypothetical protein
MPDPSIEIVNSLFQPVQNPHEDRITAILQKRAQPQSYTSPQIGSATEAAQYMALAGRSGNGVEQILDAVIRKPQLEQSNMELQSAQGLYDLFETKRANGDKQAQALFDKIALFTGGDPEGTQLFLQELHADPESIDPGNAFQVMTKLAGIAKRTGYKSPESQATKLDLEAKQLGLIKTRAEIEKINRGGDSSDLPAPLQLANEYRDARDKGDVQRMNDIILFAKSLQKGQGIDDQGNIVNMTGYTGAVQDEKSAEGFGKKFGELQGQTTFDLPRVRTVSNQAVAAIDSAISAPGLKNITGLLSKVPIVPGGERARADALLDQVGGRVFLAAYDTLKGGGQITEIEGAKAEQAIAAIGRAQSYDDVVQGLNDLRSAIIENVRTKEAQASQTPDQMRSSSYEPPPAPTYDDIGVEDMSDEDILKAIQ